MVRAAEKSYVPPKFPTILKSYAKDMIRTQPFDLLSWSAAYFRSISDEIEPPTKEHLEASGDGKERKITKEYLRALIKQVGKGYFVERSVLHRFWRNLCLSQDELLHFLGICRFLYLERIPWLKLLSVMIASLNKDFRSSMEMLCEVLTDDLEGGSNSIPVWMFTLCYEFLGELSDGEDKEIVINESYSDRPDLTPESISTKNIHKMILNMWKEFSTGSKSPTINISSNLKFHNLYDTVKESKDFQNLVNALRNVEQFKTETCDENDDSSELANNNRKFMFELLRDIGPPWSWMYQFVTHNNPCRSYNFIEQSLNDMPTSSSSANDDGMLLSDNSFLYFYGQFENYLQHKQVDLQNISSLISLIENKEMESENDDDVQHFVLLKNTFKQAEKDLVNFESPSHMKQYVFKHLRNYAINKPANSDNHSDKTLEKVTFSIRPMAGVGKPVPHDVMHCFIDYFRHRSINENGVVYPRLFSEPDCPQMD